MGDIRDVNFDPWVRKILWRRKWQPTPVLLPGESHGHSSLVDYIQSTALWRVGHAWSNLACRHGLLPHATLFHSFISAACIRCCNSSFLNSTTFYWLLFFDSSPIIAVRLLCCLLGLHMLLSYYWVLCLLKYFIQMHELLICMRTFGGSHYYAKVVKVCKSFISYAQSYFVT